MNKAISEIGAIYDWRQLFGGTSKSYSEVGLATDWLRIRFSFRRFYVRM